MADVKDPTKDSAAGIQANLLAGKYKTAEDLAEAYTQLEKKLGEMTSKHQSELAQIQATAEQYRPAHEWAQQNGQKVQQMVQEHAQMQQRLAQLQGAIAPNGGQQDPLAWLSQGERQALFQYMAPLIQQHILAPYANQMAQQQIAPYVQKMIQDSIGPVSAQQKAAIELLWGSIEGIAPEDKLGLVKQQQALMLKYSDPQKYNPREFAAEEMRRETELNTSKSRIAELEKQIEARERAAAAPMAASGGVSPFKKEGERPAPKTREERLKTVVDTVREQAGPDAMREAFPAAT